MRWQVRVFFLVGNIMMLSCNCLLLIKEGKTTSSYSMSTISFVWKQFFAVPTSVPTPSSVVSPMSTWPDSTIIAALIGLGGVVLGSAIALWTTIYQAHRSERFQRELTKKSEQLQRELTHQNELLQRNLVRIQKELEREYAAQEREEQHEQAINTVEAKKQQMLRASTNEERAQLYRDALQADPRISTIKILDMKRPLETVNIYVRLRIHQESQLSYKQEAPLVQSEPLRDPNTIFQAEHKLRELRLSTALDPETALRTYARCVLLGDPGAGKTTLLRYLALTIARQSLPEFVDFLPIYIELNAFVNSKLSDLLDYCALTWDALYAFPYEEARRYIADQLYEGKALLLLDALDETVVGETAEAAENTYTAVSLAISHIATRYPRAPMVVTARKAGYQYRAPLGGFTELDVLDFRPEDIRQFIINWYTCSHDMQGDQKIADLTLRLERHPHLQALAANPLLLSLIVIVYEAQLDLPDRRADLYKRCVETLLTEWDARRNIRRRRQFQPSHKRQLLINIAWHFHAQGQRYFSEEELLSVIADFLPTIGLPREENLLILQEIENEQGLLKEQAQGWHGFVHLTLQEYFAALAVTDDEHLRLLLRQRANPWWEEVFLLYAGSASDMSSLLQVLLGYSKGDEIREDIFLTNILLAGRCLNAHPTVRQVSLRTEVKTRLLKLLIRTPYTLLQTQIVEVLVGMSDRQVNTKLVHLLTVNQLDMELRLRIAEALGKLGERSIAPELVHLLTDEQIEEKVRWKIAEALGALGERSIAPELVRLLTHEPRVLSDLGLKMRILRQRIAEALGKLGERSIAPELVRLLTDNQLDVDSRRSIAEALGALGERSIAPELVRLLMDEQIEERVRWKIAEALGKLGERSIAPELVRLLTDNQLDMDLRLRIAEALGALGERSIAPELVRLLTDTQVAKKVRWSIAEALGELGERSIIPECVYLLSDTRLDESIRWRIAEALGALGERSIAPELVRLLSNKQIGEDVGLSIVKALGKLRERSIAPELVRLLSDTQVAEKVRWSIAIELGNLGERSVIPKLVQLLTDTLLEGSVKWSIVEALGNLGERSLAPVLVRLLADEQLDVPVRERIAKVLGKLGEESIVPDLVCLLVDEQLEEAVRQRVIEALGSLGDRSIVPRLVRLLTHEQLDIDVQRAIVDLLGKLALDLPSIQLLTPLLDNSALHFPIYDLLWAASRSAGVSIFRSTHTSQDHYDIVAWDSSMS